MGSAFVQKAGSKDFKAKGHDQAGRVSHALITMHLFAKAFRNCPVLPVHTNRAQPRL